MENLYIIVGLGNPGKKHEKTRHNAGFIVVDILSQKYDIKITQIKHKALIGSGTIEGTKVILVKPQTFMNNSGESVRDIIDWYKIPLQRVILIYDDVDLPLGKIRVRGKGSPGSHNGMKSVTYHLVSDNFPRVRVGIDKTPEGWDIIDYVLGQFTEEERKIIYDSALRATEAIVDIITSDIDQAMRKFNG